MSRTAAKHTQADIARSLRAAKQAGAGSVRLLPDGTIRIDLQSEPLGEKTENEVEYDRRIAL
jgi:sRNA-binding protein